MLCYPYGYADENRIDPDHHLSWLKASDSPAGLRASHQISSRCMEQYERCQEKDQEQDLNERRDGISKISRRLPGFCNSAVLTEIFNAHGCNFYVFKPSDVEFIFPHSGRYEYSLDKALRKHVLHDVKPVALVNTTEVPSIADPGDIWPMPSFQTLVKIREDPVHNIEIIILSHSSSISGKQGGTTWQK